MADRFSLDDIMSERDKNNNGGEQEDGFDLSFGPGETSEPEDIDDTDETEDVYVPRTAADLDESAAAQQADDAAKRIKALAKNRKKTREETDAVPSKRASVKDIDLEEDLSDKLIPQTGEIDIKKVMDVGTDAERSQALKEARQEIVENFQLKIDKDPDKIEEPREIKVVGGQKEFERFEEAPQILNDILQVKSNLFLRLCVQLFAGIFSLLITVANDLGLPVIKIFDRSVSPSSFLFTNTILGLLAVAVSYNIMTAGIKNMIRRKPDCDSVAAIGMFVSVIAGIVTLFDPESLRTGFYHVYISAAIIGLVFNTLGKMMIVQRAEKNFRYIAGEFDRYAVKPVAEESSSSFTKGATGGKVVMTTLQKTEFVEDFIKNSYSPDISDRFAQKVSWFVLIFGAAMGVMAFLTDKNAANTTEKMHAALAAFSGAATMCASVSLMLAVNVPVSRASKRFLQYSSVMLGYSAVEEYSDTNSVLVDAAQLFPKESVDLVNLKLMSNSPLEECILMAASLACQSGSVLKNAFYRILKGKTEMLYPVESYIFEDEQGLSGWINNKRVLLGTRRHMENHSIDGLPPQAKEDSYGKGNIVLYLSISGVVSAIFVVRAVPSIAVSKWMRELQREGIITFVRTVDGFLTEDYLEKLFNVGHGSVRLLPFRFHKEYEKETDYTERVSSSMLCSGHFPSFAMMITGIKHVKATAQFGLAIQAGAMALAAVICLVSMITGTFNQITPSLVITYNLVFTGITMLFLSGKKI